MSSASDPNREDTQFRRDPSDPLWDEAVGSIQLVGITALVLLVLGLLSRL